MSKSCNAGIIILFSFFLLISNVFGQSKCRTPNGENTHCKSIYDCPLFLRTIRNNPTPETQKFLKESQCGYTNVPLVCCGSMVTYHRFNPSPPVRTTPFPVRNPQPYVTSNPSKHRNVNLIPKVGSCGQHTSENKVLGGNETEIDEFPWVALMEYRKNGRSTGHTCGGVLISDRYLLTAAHCVIGSITEVYGYLFRVRLGEYDTSTTRDCQIIYEGEAYEVCSDPHQDIDVEDVIPHPNYNLDKQEHNDIALIRLTRPVQFNDFVRPICLPLNGERKEIGSDVVIAGWGQTERSRSSNVKLKAYIPVVSTDHCSRVYSQLQRTLTDNQFCAGGLRGIDSCKGDSGGPVMSTWQGRTDWYVAGIVSYGPFPCGQAGWPGVYTRVSNYVNWILDNIRP